MFRFVQHRRIYFLISAIVLSASIIAMGISVARTGFPFLVGVDFESGTRFEVQFTEAVDENEIRAVFNEFEVSNPSVTSLRGENLENAWQIRTEAMTPEMIEAVQRALNEQVAPLNPEAVRVENVSASVAGEVTRSAGIAIVVAAVIVLLYIMFVFRQVPNPFRYGASAVAAMLHDIIVIFGFMAIMGLLLGWEADALFLTSALTVSGFSLQHTFVVFSPIRESFGKHSFA